MESANYLAMPTTGKVDAVILAGGQGRRVGYQQKALLNYQGKPMLQWVQQVLQPQVNQVLVNANAELESYQQFSNAIFSDQSQGYLGPLAGMQAAWHYSDKDWLLFVPCDNPNIAEDLLDRLLTACQQQPAAIVVAFDGQRIQPLYLLMHRSCLPELDKAIHNRHLSVKRWIAEQPHTKADFSDIAESAFLNLNKLQVE